MSVSRVMRGVAMAVVSLGAMACAESPTAIGSNAVANAIIPARPGPNVGAPDGEYFEVCKVYRNGTGPQVQIDVAVSNGTTFFVLLNDGECRDVWLHGSGRQTVTVTEVVPAGYTASFVKSVLLGSTVTTDPEAAGNSASGGVNGNPREGTTITFYNTPIPPPPPGPSCTLTQGYWKNHTEDWDDAGDNKVFLSSDIFYNSGVSYIDILNTPPSGGNAYLQLAHQFIAASLNVNGASSGDAAVDAALAGADAYFAGAATGIPKPSGAEKTQLQAWATLLESFNSGGVGPGHCD